MNQQITNVDADALWAAYVTDHTPQERDLHALLVSKNYFAPKAAQLLLEGSRNPLHQLLNARLIIVYGDDETVKAKAADVLLAKSQLSDDLQLVMYRCRTRTEIASKILFEQNPSQQDLLTIVDRSSEWRIAAWERVDKTALTEEDVCWLVFNHAGTQGNVTPIIREICEMVLRDGKSVKNLDTVLREGYKDMAEEAARLLLKLDASATVLGWIVTYVPKYSKVAWQKMKEKSPEKEDLLQIFDSREVEGSTQEEAFALLEQLDRHQLDVSRCIWSDNVVVRERAIGMALDFGCVEGELAAVCEYGNSIERTAAASRLLAMTCGIASLTAIPENVPEFREVATKRLAEFWSPDEDVLVEQILEANVICVRE